MLGDAERRARILESPALTGLTEPKDVAERLYLDAFKASSEELKEGREDAVLRRWDGMATYLEKYPEHRAWYLLARKRADNLRQQMDKRRQIVEAEIARARTAYESGRFDEGLRILDNTIQDYEKYAYLEPVIQVAKRQKAAWTDLPTDVNPPGFPNTPEGAYREYVLRHSAADLSGLGNAPSASTGDSDLSRLLREFQKIAPDGAPQFQRMVEEQLPVRQLDVGEEVVLPDATTYRVSPDDVGEDRVVVAPEGLVGLPLRVHKIDGRWCVVPDSTQPSGSDHPAPSHDPVLVPEPRAASPDASRGVSDAPPPMEA